MLLGGLHHLLEFFEHRFGDPHFPAAVADVGRHVLHQIKLAVLEFFQIDFFGLERGAASLADLFRFLEKLGVFLVQVAVLFFFFWFAQDIGL